MRADHAQMTLLGLNILTQVRHISSESSINNHIMPHLPDLVWSVQMYQCPHETASDEYHLRDMDLGDRKIGCLVPVEDTLNGTIMGLRIIIPKCQNSRRNQESKVCEHQSHSDVSPSRIIVQIVVQDWQRGEMRYCGKPTQIEDYPKCLALIEQCLLNPTMRIAKPVTSC
jgi:hypothetical protein